MSELQQTRQEVLAGYVLLYVCIMIILPVCTVTLPIQYLPLPIILVKSTMVQSTGTKNIGRN